MFGVVKGQDIAVKMLTRELANDALPQALLFHGPEGSGKFLTALELARVVNCAKEGRDGCDCASCRGITNLSTKNVFFICKSSLMNTFELWRSRGAHAGNLPWFLRDVKRLSLGIFEAERYRKDYEFLEESLRSLGAAVSKTKAGDAQRLPIDKILECVFSLLDTQKTPIISVDKVRELQRFLWMKSGEGRCKVVLVDGAEHMSEEAQNSFLKISEDTPPDSIIIITAARKDLLKETIQSRFRTYRFRALSSEARDAILKERFAPFAGGLSNAEKGAPREEGYDAKAMEEYRVRLASGKHPAGELALKTLLEIIDEILEKGQAVQFFSFIIDRLGMRLRRAAGFAAAYPQRGITVEELYEIELSLKAAAFARSSILTSNANPGLVLTDFLLNNRRNSLQW